MTKVCYKANDSKMNGFKYFFIRPKFDTNTFNVQTQLLDIFTIDNTNMSQ